MALLGDDFLIFIWDEDGHKTYWLGSDPEHAIDLLEEGRLPDNSLCLGYSPEDVQDSLSTLARLVGIWNRTNNQEEK